MLVWDEGKNIINHYIPIDSTIIVPFMDDDDDDDDDDDAGDGDDGVGVLKFFSLDLVDVGCCEKNSQELKNFTNSDFNSRICSSDSSHQASPCPQPLSLSLDV